VDLVGDHGPAGAVCRGEILPVLGEGLEAHQEHDVARVGDRLHPLLRGSVDHDDLVILELREAQHLLPVLVQQGLRHGHHHALALMLPEILGVDAGGRGLAGAGIGEVEATLLADVEREMRDLIRPEFRHVLLRVHVILLRIEVSV